MDYKLLLEKYIRSVLAAEGTTFIPYELFTTVQGGEFTKEEIEELIKLDEGNKRQNAHR